MAPVSGRVSELQWLTHLEAYCRATTCMYNDLQTLALSVASHDSGKRSLLLTLISILVHFYLHLFSLINHCMVTST